MPCLGQAELAGLRAAEPLRMATDQRIAGTLPLKAVGRPAFTRAAVPRSILLLTWAKIPMAATTIAQRSPTTTIFKWVARSAL